MIRDCQLEEASAVLELWRQAGAIPSSTDTEADLHRAIDSSLSQVLLAEGEGQVVGTIIGTFDGWRGNIYRLAVLPVFRRRGIARALVAEVEKRLAQHGAKRVTALVEKDHPEATGFWEAVGYPLDQRLVRHVRSLPAEASEPPGHLTFLLPINDHLCLTEFRSGDKTALLEILQEKDIYDRTSRIPHPYTEANAERWLALVAKITEQHGQPVQWAIRNRFDDLIGAIGFEGLQIGKSHRAEIGYWLAKPSWGRGIMTAVVQKACDYAFREWGLTKIIAHVFAFNLASARVLEKCGFEQEGYLKKHFRKEGQLIDGRLYGLSR